VATLVMTLVMAHLPRFDPAASGDAGPWRGIRGLWLAALVGLLGLQGVIAAVAMDPFFDAGRALAILCGVSLVLFGNHLPTVRQSWFLGIRTPWTMTSRRAWVQTHRLGGRVFVLVGIGAVASGVVGTGELAPIGPVVIAVLIAWVALTAFSFRVWHTDPDREVT
jgi:uncharacterized membrane protein